MTLSLLPPAPSRADPVNFAARADAFLAALQLLVPQWNSDIAAIMAGDSAASLALNLASENGADFVGTEAGITLQEYLRGCLYASNLVPGQTSDNYIALRAWLDKAKAGNKRLLLPAGTYGFSDTLTIDDTIELAGAGRDKTVLNFINSTSLKPAILLGPGSSKSTLSGFTLSDETFGMSRGIEIRNSAGDPGNAWKNTFIAVEVVGFGEAVAYTTNSPLSGTTHIQSSENRWLNCKFSKNVITVRNINCQSVNNTMLGCDYENTDGVYHGTAVTDTWTFFKDEAGGHNIVNGGSLIGKGKWFEWEQKTGSTNLFSGAQFIMENIRVEARSPHNGVCINEAVHGNTGSLSMDLQLRNVNVVAYGQTLDLLRYGGRLDFQFDSVNTIQGTGALIVRQYPTTGRTSNTTTASQGKGVINTSSVDIVVETTSPYGAYNANATGLILRDGCLTSSTNSSMSTDANGWFQLTGNGNSAQLGMQLNDGVRPTWMIWNNDNPGNTLTGDAKIKLPKGARPLRLIVFKQSQAVAGDSGWELYVCKDAANWATPGTFALGTDATLVAATGVTTNKAGFLDANVVLTAAGFVGNELRAGKTGWTDGYLYFKKTGATAFPGWFGIEYI